MEAAIDKRTRAYKDSQAEVESDKPDYTKSKDNPGFKLCMNCGTELEYNADGSPKWRGQPELCNPCVWRKDKK